MRGQCGEACSSLSPLTPFHSLLALADQPLRQQRYRATGGEALATFFPRGAGDIQMGPALAIGEARQEAAGGDRAIGLAADVGDVGEAGFQLRLVVVPQRQARSRVSSPAASSSAARSSCLLIRPLACLPKATTQAPVRVAASMMVCG